MEDRVASGVIRQIQYGLIPTLPSLVIRVNTPARFPGKEGYVIVEITEDKNTFLEFGYFEYLIFIGKPDQYGKMGPEGLIFWKRYTQKPDAIEYFFPDELDARLV